MTAVGKSEAAGLHIAEGRTKLQVAAAAFGVIFLLVGVAGFIPGVTADFERLDVFGDVAAKLLGVFGVNWLENLVHLAYGVGGLALATTTRRSWLYFMFGGALYLVIALFGFVIDPHHEANFLGVNEAGNWLHVAIFATMVTIGAVLGRDTRDRR